MNKYKYELEELIFTNYEINSIKKILNKKGEQGYKLIFIEDYNTCNRKILFFEKQITKSEEK